jgi:hypothetical protein
MEEERLTVSVGEKGANIMIKIFGDFGQKKFVFQKNVMALFCIHNLAVF